MCAFVLATIVPAFAQVQGGSISGSVKDEQGGVLPGTTVTVQGVDATLTSTVNGAGQYRFLELAPGPYKVTVELASFATVTRDVIVAVGRTVDFPVTLKLSSRGETIAVTAAAPIVDPKITGTAINFTSHELEKIPTSRDPFALMRTVPGVLLDQVNIAGNETGQQPNVLGKGSRQQDTTWAVDGVEITDMGAPGQAATYFNFDSFEELQVSTAGHDIRSRTGGVGINLVTKRGTNQFHGGARGYFSNDSLEGSNIPNELKATVTPQTADHTDRTSDYGFEFGGPLVKDKAWIYASLSQQDIRIFKRTITPAGVDSTKLRNPQVKVNWQATSKDMVNFLFFNGYKLKDGRANPGNATTLSTFDATHHQDNAYTDNPMHGLWKIGDDRVINANTFLSAKYAYYNTGIALTPEGGTSAQAGRTFVGASQAYGSTSENLFLRPQHSFTADMTNFARIFGMSHDLKYGVGYRHVLAATRITWPGNGIVAIEQTATDLRAQVFRQVNGANEVSYLDFYVGDTLSLHRTTVDVGVRYDRQAGNALAATTEGSNAFPALVPGVIFGGYDAPFTWKNFSPRAGLSYLLDANGKTVARASYSRFAGQLAPSTVGTLNPSTGSTAGSRTYRWNDLNGDRFAQANEVDLAQQLAVTGIDPANPTALAPSPNQLDAGLKAPVTQSFVAGIERELRPNLAVMVDYSYNRTTNLFGNLTGNLTPRVGVPLSAYIKGDTLTGTLPDGSTYSVPTFIPTGVTAGSITRNVPGFYVDYQGLELNLVKRLSNKWMGRLTFGYNNAREHFTNVEGRYNTNGNPTPTPAEPLIDGGQFAPTATVAGGIFMNAKWQFNANGMYLAPYGIEVAANVFGRQGYPLPMYRGPIDLRQPAPLLGDTSQNILVSPKIDTFRLENVWDTDVRVARPFRMRAGNQMLDVRLVADVFNLFNANTALARVSNLGNLTTPNTAFNSLIKNMSPRIVRLGLVVGF